MAAEVLTEPGDRLAFRHDLLSQAVYQDIAEPLRRGLHRAPLRPCRSSMRRSRTAAHLVLGTQPGDEQASAVLTQAVGELSPTSATAAADLSLRILDLIGPDDPRRRGLVTTTVGLLGRASKPASPALPRARLRSFSGQVSHCLVPCPRRSHSS